MKVYSDKEKELLTQQAIAISRQHNIKDPHWFSALTDEEAFIICLVDVDFDETRARFALAIARGNIINGEPDETGTVSLY